jgi:hypothetical protein
MSQLERRLDRAPATSGVPSRTDIFSVRRQVSKGATRIRHGDGGGILSNCVIELRLLTHACCERTNNCLRGT